MTPDPTFEHLSRPAGSMAGADFGSQHYWRSFECVQGLVDGCRGIEPGLTALALPLPLPAPAAPVPEPAAALLMGLGLLGVWLWGRHRQ